MNIEYHRLWSTALSQDMEFKIYGHAGKPVIVFPTQGGRFYQYEDYSMVGACSAFIAEGKLQLFTLDSIDDQSWANWNAHPADRVRRHNQYDQYVMEEVVPFIRERSPAALKFLATGCSMGGYHAVNFFFRHPDIFDSVISLSGIFRLNMFIGGYMDENVYFNSPLAYLPDLTDEWYLEQYRNSQIIVCAGQGAWEDEMLTDAHALKLILEEKGVPCWIDLWGQDVNHDWPWWRKQMPYFLGQLDL
ncbi:MAG TPA: alpha/beta hydrolase-fold protein [Anaerolineales bacterium]|nr:alpha/beta hydrolase-fold protein [Anaerolineales bacterium]